ncbi:unnamed protein product [Caenorhabditis angaria]|uniref:tRNA(Phe) (4-demethylwyosine(37)-C(7)) aminocarboxypropyltransferase n=1 Tax=Caenorhabditis angaria TaxID=860376 RepID=A0A9P1IUC9_9PELO|nr:unnamed protein product [Caenorhabditis angaria]
MATTLPPQILSPPIRKTSDALLAKASNFGQLLEEVKKLAISKSLWDDEMQRDLPKKWEKHGDMIVFPQNSFTHINWRFIGRELWPIVAKSLNVARIARKRQIDEMRTAHVDLLFGKDGWVDYVDEREVRFCYDTTVRVFNNSKKTEMKRISKWACQGQTIIDLYCSLGYYSLTFLVACEARQVIAIDWNEEILESLVRSAQINNVDDRLLVIHGDCRRVSPNLAADRIYLGLLPSCRAHWLVACKALKVEGGILHINEIIDMTPEKPPAEKKKTVVVKKKVLKKQSTLPAVIENQPTSSGKDLGEEKEAGAPTIPEEENGEESAENGQKKKKFTRSASIVEEMENRVLPDVQIWKEFDETFQKLPAKLRNFANDCAQNCTRFLNNIHLSDHLYAVTIINVVRYGEVSKNQEHIVLELLCCPQNSSVEHMISKFTSENLKN